MNTVNKKGPIFDPGLCRCCGTIKKCRVLNVEYESFGQKEVYSDMMMDCFGLLLSHLESKVSERLVCATCVTRLREAFTFKRQVLQCEQAFLEMRMMDCSETTSPQLLSTDPSTAYEDEIIKKEPPDPDDEVDNDRDHTTDHHLDDTAEDSKVDLQPPEDIITDINPAQKPSDLDDDLPLQCSAKEPKLVLRMNKMHSFWMKQHVSSKSNTEDSKPDPQTPEEINTDIHQTQEPSDLDDDIPLQCLTKKPKLGFKVNKMHSEMHSFWMKQHVSGTSNKPPISKVQQLIREKDHSYMIDSNILQIIENSFAVPFKCRHNNLICYYCGIVFVDPKLLRNHTHTHHNPKKFKLSDRDHKNMIKIDLAKIDCRLCDAKIENLDEFKRHVVENHGKKYYFDCPDTVLPFKLDFEDFKCALCFIGFPYFHALNKHMNEHFSNYICETCGLGFVDNNRFLTHQSRHEEGNYPCETCGRLFKSVTNRELHIDRVHKRRGRVYCPKCDVVLMSHAQKMKHLVEVHGEQPISLPCSACQKVFETRRTFTIHWRKEHLKDYRYECQTCGQKFFTSFALKNHMPTHTGERNFSCKVCHKTYPRLKTLKEHMRIHTNDRRYRCHICGQAFIQNCSLKGHMKSQHPEYG